MRPGLFRSCHCAVSRFRSSSWIKATSGPVGRIPRGFRPLSNSSAICSRKGSQLLVGLQRNPVPGQKVGDQLYARL